MIIHTSHTRLTVTQSHVKTFLWFVLVTNLTKGDHLLDSTNSSTWQSLARATELSIRWFDCPQTTPNIMLQVLILRVPMNSLVRYWSPTNASFHDPYTFLTSAFLHFSSNHLPCDLSLTYLHNFLISSGFPTKRPFTLNVEHTCVNSPVAWMALNSHAAVTGFYTMNHKKRDILFLTITLANLNRFLK